MDEGMARLVIQLDSESANPEELADLMGQLKAEISELPVQSITDEVSGPAPAGSKGMDWVSVGTVAIQVAPATVTMVFSLLRSWADRHRRLPVKVRVRAGGHAYEVEYDPAIMTDKQLDALIASLRNPAKS
jgi:hypothetical protein